MASRLSEDCTGETDLSTWNSAPFWSTLWNSLQASAGTIHDTSTLWWWVHVQGNHTEPICKVQSVWETPMPRFMCCVVNLPCVMVVKCLGLTDPWQLHQHYLSLSFSLHGQTCLIGPKAHFFSWQSFWVESESGHIWENPDVFENRLRPVSNPHLPLTTPSPQPPYEYFPEAQRKSPPALSLESSPL